MSRLLAVVIIGLIMGTTATSPDLARVGQARADDPSGTESHEVVVGDISEAPSVIRFAAAQPIAGKGNGDSTVAKPATPKTPVLAQPFMEEPAETPTAVKKAAPKTPARQPAITMAPLDELVPPVPSLTPPAVKPVVKTPPAVQAAASAKPPTPAKISAPALPPIVKPAPVSPLLDVPAPKATFPSPAAAKKPAPRMTMDSADPFPVAPLAKPALAPQPRWSPSPSDLPVPPPPASATATDMDVDPSGVYYSDHGTGCDPCLKRLGICPLCGERHGPDWSLWRSPCDMVQHHKYFPPMHGYYYFIPYHYSHVPEHQAFVTRWGGDPRNPYDNEIFQRINAEYRNDRRVRTFELPEPKVVLPKPPKPKG